MPRKQYTVHYIYKITNIITNKFYIGMHSTFNIDDGYFGSGKVLWRSLNKYGKENHKKEILEFLPDRLSLKSREKELVNIELLKNKLCMNLMVGGKGGCHKNSFGGYEGRMKGIIIGHKKFYTDKVFRENRLNLLKENRIKIKNLNSENNRFSGHTHTDETKLKMSVVKAGKYTDNNNSQYGTCWIYNLELKENKKIKREDLEYWVTVGWLKGRKMNFIGK